MAHTLVIVESPTKARTIRGFLPRDFKVEASMGHVRDLPNNASEIPAAHKGEKWANLGVNTANNFEPLYVVPKDKKKVVKELKDALKGADQLLLATDEDREGESISWHLLQLLAPKVPVKRMVFHEITKEAIGRALEQTRELDMQLVHAQETRRILDRLVGYTLSPLLWKKVAWGLSAGRVQSVAVRLLVQRERARRAFRSGSYWDLKARLEQAGAGFEAKLTHLKGERIAGGADFDESTGALKAGSKVKLLSEVEARTLQAAVQGAAWRVAEVEEKPTVRKPVPPFTTSTLQQEANRKLRLSARETMRTAQGLYERGFITYMRTDSVHLSDQAINAARSCVSEKYGKDYLSPSPRQFSTKARNAQEAHEAIRPAGESFRTPNETGLKEKDLALYDLIWKRTVASQMADARLTMLAVELQVDGGSLGPASFRASGKRIDFAGFFRAYVEGSDDPDAALEGQEVLLPSLKVGDSPACQAVEALGHQTQPPARYSEAALVKMLEKEGIGRPSTYASIIGTIVDRGYATLANNALTPSFTAFAVTALLEEHFPDLVDTSFTARMENTLDEISHGKVSWLPYLESFYKGEQGLETQVQQREGDIDPTASRTIELEGLPCVVRIGRFGAYLETKRVADDGTEELLKATLPQEITPADLDAEKAELILKQKAEGPESLGEDPETGDLVYLLFGQYGPYVQRGQVSDDNPKPKRASLPKGVKPEDLSLEDALGLLRLPRHLGEHPDGGKVEAGLGRFGPYVVHHKGKGEKDYRSLKAEDDVLVVGLSRALELLATPKKGRGGRTALKDLGTPEGDGEAIQLFDGPYGLYVKQGKVNASLPEGATADTITLEQAVELLAAKASSGKGKGRKTAASKASTAGSSAKTAAAKTTGTRAAAAKPAAKKSPGTTKTGRLRASAVRVIKPAGS
ncbi:type I DNA topoisomerase [Vulcanococcus limneticus Candia 3F8]|uniref:type I DNA topoisomerase n=1 Tax=Vulcanococcus limneticus TaxID=2170428 RepID=UPI000B98D21D|nr:type I DNA topoisomerase [Vulcanococcus limneticus]MCP9790833.1 type I DNA topoisomerase [Vulcanococcus limneticus MW73D5]MCP9892824.1 type I DNA topoisomerase [Vulcanococcus limneticus Candia 3F8]MCP9896440.1 type I DNA topoisomerase [Vulcanococcus limneticus Candia 3B3]